jgi:MOSC domain-containing protein YiiM
VTGQLRAIWLKRFKKGPMDPGDMAILVAGQGLLGNAHKGGRRQVILLEEDAWADALAEIPEILLNRSVPLDPSTRRANLLVSGFPLEGTRGRILRIGPARLRIWSECAPCHQMDEACAGLQAALRPRWRGGACAEVVEGGEIRVGDEIVWEEAPETL